MENLPAYVSIVFILTTFVTLGFLIYSIKVAGADLLPSKLLIFVLPLWIFFQAVLARGGFYQYTEAMPPRLMLFGVLPAVILIFIYLLFFRDFVAKLPLKVLTLLHTVRIPVEIVLFLLFVGRQVPEIMTFEGRNFDILSGILAPIVYLAAFRNNEINRPLLVAYNLLGLLLLANIVTIAVLAVPSPMQTTAFEQPNVAVLYFPYIWLPTIVVPIVFFSHLASLWKIFTGHEK